MLKAIKTEIQDGEATIAFTSSEYTYEEAQEALLNEYKERKKVKGVKVTKNLRGMTALYPSGFVMTIQLVQV